MGLDQYLYRTSKKDFDKMKKYAESYTKYESTVVSAIEAEDGKWNPFFESLPRDEYGDVDFGKLTPEQEKKRREYNLFVRDVKRKSAEALGLVLDDSVYLEPIPPADLENAEELYYWRKNWDLHNYIVEHFWGDKENDNCVDIPLGKEQLKELVKAGFDPEVFTRAYESLDDDHVVYYHPWY